MGGLIKDVGLNVQGYATDSDLKYLSYAKSFANFISGETVPPSGSEQLFNILEFTYNSLGQILHKYKFIHWFQDALHLIQCERY